MSLCFARKLRLCASMLNQSQTLRYEGRQLVLLLINISLRPYSISCGGSPKQTTDIQSPFRASRPHHFYIGGGAFKGVLET